MYRSEHSDVAAAEAVVATSHETGPAVDRRVWGVTLSEPMTPVGAWQLLYGKTGYR
jgi:hypothetical protein